MKFKLVKLGFLVQEQTVDNKSKLIFNVLFTVITAYLTF